MAVLDQAIVSGASFLSTVFVARTLGLEGLGAFGVFSVAVGLCLSLQAAGVFGPLMVRGTAAYAEAPRRFVGAALVLGVTSAGVAGVVVFLAADSGPYGLSQLSWLCSGAAAAWVFQDFVRRLCFAIGMPTAALASDAISYGTQLAMLAMCSATGVLSLSGALWIVCATSLTATAIFLPAAFRMTFDWRYIRTTCAEGMRDGGWLLGSAGAQWAATSAPILVAPLFFGPSAAGALRACQNIMGVSHLWFQGLENVVPTRAAAILAHQGPAQLAAYTRAVLKRWGAVTLLALSGIALFSEEILYFAYGSAGSGHRALVTIYAVYYCVAFLCIPLGASLRALRKSDVVFRAIASGTLCGLVISLLLVKVLGLLSLVVGMAAGRVIAVAVLSVRLQLLFAARISGISHQSEARYLAAIPSEILQETLPDTAELFPYPASAKPRLLLPASRVARRSACKLFLPKRARLDALVRSSLAPYGNHSAFRAGVVLQRLTRQFEDATVALSIGNAAGAPKLTAAVLQSDGRAVRIAKIAYGPAVERLQREAAWLHHLAGFKQIAAKIPRVEDAWYESGVFVLEMQLLCNHATAPYRFQKQHIEFLAALQSIDIAPESATCASVSQVASARLAALRGKLPQNVSELLHAALEIASQRQEQVSAPGGISHGDFVPWNVRRSGQALVVLDWEMASILRPRLYDYFHYHLLPHALRRPVQMPDIERLVDRTISQLPKTWYGKSTAIRVQLLTYLLDVVTFYLQTQQGENCDNVVVQRYCGAVAILNGTAAFEVRS